MNQGRRGDPQWRITIDFAEESLRKQRRTKWPGVNKDYISRRSIAGEILNLRIETHLSFCQLHIRIVYKLYAK